MKSFGFEVAHGYEILKGFVNAPTKERAVEFILKEEWGDIIDEYDTDEFTKGYEITDIWEIDDESEEDE